MPYTVEKIFHLKFYAIDSGIKKTGKSVKIICEIVGGAFLHIYIYRWENDNKYDFMILIHTSIPL